MNMSGVTALLFGFDIEGYNADKYNCEDWRGTIKDGSIHGKVYINFNNRNYDFTLTEVVK